MPADVFRCVPERGANARVEADGECMCTDQVTVIKKYYDYGASGGPLEGWKSYMETAERG